MNVEIKYKLPNSNPVSDLRALVCGIQNGHDCKGENPLPTFNSQLDIIAQRIFDEGREFGKKYPEL